METLACNFHSFYLSNTQTVSLLKFPLHQVPCSSSSASALSLRMTHPHSARNPVIEQQRVIIPNKHGERLVGLLHETGSKEIVVLCHGFRSTKADRTIVNLAVALETEGISAFRFDFAGNGANRMVSAILGHSKGGNVVLLYASKYHDIHTVVNVSGRYDLKKGIEERLGKHFMNRINTDGFVDVKNKTGSVLFRVSKESLMDRLSTDMHEACLKIPRECRVLTVHGSADEIIPVEDALEFAKIVPNHQLHIVEGADHIYTCHQTELASVVLSYLKAALQQD
ncbi:hypothetical protein DITRI_Ditri03aG0052500 [Diplodiscus trichospermus]